MDFQDERAQTPMGEESNILERVARTISSVRGAKPDYAHLAAELEPALPFDIFGIVLLRHDREAVRITVCQRDGESWVARYRQHPLAGSMVECMLASFPPQGVGQNLENIVRGAKEGFISTHEPPPVALLVKSFPAGATGLPAECGDALCGNPRLRAALVAPLLADGKMLGTLELGSTLPGAYDDPVLQRSINALASLLATAIEGHVGRGNVEIQDRQRAELKDVSTVLATAVDLPMILQRIVLGITNALHVSSAIVRLDRRHLRLEAQSGLNFDPGTLQTLLDAENALDRRTIIGATLLSRQPCVSQDIAQDERFPESRCLASELGVHSLFCYPLITGQYVYGALLLLSSEPGGFTPLKTDIFSLFAGQATVAVHNGMLLQSAQERRRFQDVIEQLERAHQQNVFLDQDEADEADLLKRLRVETMNTFGVSLSSVLRFISDHLLSRSERHLQEILRTSQGQSSREEERRRGELAFAGSVAAYQDDTVFLESASGIDSFAVATDVDGALILMQAAETALADTKFLRDISAALMRALRVDEAHPQAYEQLKRELAEPWFIVDSEGICVYLNRAAEMFCGMPSGAHSAHTWQRWPEESSPLFGSFRPLASGQKELLTLEQALAPLLLRMRQVQDVLAYLRDFILLSHANDGVSLPASLRCTLAAEALPGQAALKTSTRESASAEPPMEAQVPRAIIAPPTHKHAHTSSPSMLLDSSPSDRHYQFVRHTLYNEYGQWLANALYIHDITEQVRDEKNKAVLLASVSHDLRTPLTAIKAAVTGLLQTNVVWNEDLRREILQDIDAETDHLNTLVNSLVDMSQIEMGALILDKEWCDVVEIVHTTLTRFQRMLSDFTISTCIQPPLPLISADYVQLERVMRNLLENATRYSPKGTEISVVVDVLAQKALPSGLEGYARWVRVQVIDQGPGIPEEERERIFKSFYSLDLQGNGLGLAICRGIVEAHQGRIWIEAAAGRGSCFVFVLPITS